jgi:hypothetical protein
VKQLEKVGPKETLSFRGADIDHDMSHAQPVADRIMVIERGTISRIITAETPLSTS